MAYSRLHTFFGTDVEANSRYPKFDDRRICIVFQKGGLIIMIDKIEELDLSVYYLRSDELDKLKTTSKIFDVVLLSPPFNVADKNKPFQFGEEHQTYLSKVEAWLDEAIRHIHKQGSILVYGLPRWLPYYAEYLHKRMTFKYWIAIKNLRSTEQAAMPAYHEGVLLFIKRPKQFRLNKVRYPHIMCSQCDDFLADWGGKKHLRHKYGSVISDVWDDRDDFIDDEHGLAPHTLNRLLDLTCREKFKVLIAAYDNEPYQGTFPLPETNASIPLPIKPKQLERPMPPDIAVAKPIDFTQDKIFIGDCVEVLAGMVEDKQARFDLIFADPPYNLEKNYGKAQDGLAEQEYVQWCDKWLYLCTQLLKPHGSLYILNLPKWTYLHATLLNKYLHFQHWIIWDALSDPRGKVMPAHYGLLFYTKHPTEYTFNSLAPIPQMNQCLRAKCIKKRKTVHTETLSDVWHDVHRIKHKRDRDAHPCQLPHKLLNRVIQLSSNSGDLVLDPFMGTGTTAIVAKRLGRHYAGIDIDVKYRDIAMTKLSQISTNGIGSVTYKNKPKQLELWVQRHALDLVGDEWPIKTVHHQLGSNILCG